eukprot:756999-Hanusia_phi.AAC.6
MADVSRIRGQGTGPEFLCAQEEGDIRQEYERIDSEGAMRGRRRGKEREGEGRRKRSRKEKEGEGRRRTEKDGEGRRRRRRMEMILLGGRSGEQIRSFRAYRWTWKWQGCLGAKPSHHQKIQGSKI